MFHNICLFRLQVTHLNTVNNVVNARCMDCISTQMVRLYFSVIRISILHVINYCFQQCYSPESWKLSFHMLLKKSSSLQWHKTNQLITYLLWRKCLLYQQLNEYLNENKFFPLYQSGFRKGFSSSQLFMRWYMITAID